MPNWERDCALSMSARVVVAISVNFGIFSLNFDPFTLSVFEH